jgi:ribosomal protein L40E
VAEVGPPPVGAPRQPLTRRERWTVAAAALAPVGLAVVVLVPIAIATSASAGDVVVAAVVYGGLLGLASGFVAVDRLQARQCPRCGTRNPRRAGACEACGYDLVRRPRYACTERHEVHLAPGLCDCGRRLGELEVARGVGPEVRFMLRAGLWLLAFLVVVGLLLRSVPV